MPALTAVRPARRVYLGLVAGPYDALSTVVWTEIPNAKVKATTLRWGAQHELARVEPSYVSLLIDNRNGAFETTNPAGFGYPNLRPLNRLQIVDCWPANLLTANQESLETNTAGWAADSNCTIARSTAAANEGSASLALTATAAGLMTATTPTGTSGIPVLPSTVYLAHLFAASGAGTMATSIVVRWYDAGGALISGPGGTGVFATAAGFTPDSTLVTSPANAAFAAVVPVMAAASGGQVGYVDSITFAPAFVRFTGYVSSWPRSWTGINRATVTIEAYDALGAVLNAVDVPNHPYEMAVRKVIESVPATGKAVWLRLDETSGTVAADSSGYGLDGQYQGAPTLGLDGLVIGDADKAFSPGAGQRASLPYKALITGYPWSAHFRFMAAPNRAAIKSIFMAYDGATLPVSQLLQVFIQSNTVPADAGKIVALVSNPYPSAGSQSVSSIVVDDGVPHDLDIVMASSTSLVIRIDGTDRTVVSVSGSHVFPDDLKTGYALGNVPAVAFGDGPLAISVADVLDEALILDGYALTPTDSSDLTWAATSEVVPWHTGEKLSLLLSAIGWPLADRDIDTGLTIVQAGWVAGKALAFAQKLELTEGGRVFVTGAGVITFLDRHAVLQPPYTVSQMIFGDGAGEVGYVPTLTYGEDDVDIWNDIPVGNVGQAVQVARDKASKDRYGWKTLLGLTDLLGRSAQEARDRANHDLAIYKDPVTRIRSITIKPQEDAAQGTDVWPDLLGLGQNSRVTVKAQPPGCPLITQESHVEHFEEQVTPQEWQVGLRLSAAETAAFWILGTSALGTGTRLAY